MVVMALHHAAEAAACLAAADAGAVEMAVRGGRLYVPTRSLPSGYDVPYRYAKATPGSTRGLLGADQRPSMPRPGRSPHWIAWPSRWMLPAGYSERRGRRSIADCLVTLTIPSGDGAAMVGAHSV